MRSEGIVLVALVFGAHSLPAQGALSGRWDRERLSHDAVRYDVDLVLPDTGTRIKAVVTTRWRLRGPGPIVVDLDDAMTVRGATVRGVPVKWRRVGDRIELPVSGRAGTEVTSTIGYDGIPILGLFVQGSGPSRTIFADNWPNRAHLWLASQDHPGDKAAVGLRVVAPAGYEVVATGRLLGVDSLPDGGRRWRFDNPEPVPVYTMVVGMARFAVTRLSPACAARCVPVSVWTYPEDSAFAVNGPFRNASAILAFFSTRIAPFPYQELRHVESSTKYGGMENATAIFYDEKAYRARNTREEVVAHETAHQWFGDAVTERDWHHLWLSEGFATYGAALWAEHQGGDSALRATMRGARTTVLESEATEKPILDSTVTNPSLLLNSNSYQKGSWVLHSLRGLIGDSAFFRGLARFYRAFEHKNALSSDFARVMAEAAGQDLGWFFRQSLTQPGYPVFEVSTEVDGGHLVLTLRQVQKKEWGSYRIPNTVDVAGRTTRLATHWSGDAPPRVVEIDPDGWWLLSVRGESNGKR
jgi:aminopeptidase N